MDKETRKRKSLHTTSRDLSWFIAQLEAACSGLRQIRGLVGSKALQGNQTLEAVTAWPLASFRAFELNPRVYPYKFGEGLKNAMDGWRAQATLRQKQCVDSSKTDVELFRSLDVEDLWHDANLLACYRYLRGNKKIAIPACWESALAEFDAELASMSGPSSG